MSKNDQRVNELMQKVESQEASLGPRPKISYNTNAKFNFSEDTSINFNTAQKPSLLVEAMALLLEKKSFYEQAAEMLGVPSPFSWFGYSFEEWQEDIKARLDLIKWQLNKKKLDATKKQLETLLSSEGKTSKVLDSIEDMLGD